jgi:glucose/arabinose dehydrogenase
MLHTRSLPLLSLATFLSLSACDGGNGGPPPQQPNQPPSFTSAASVTVPENSGGAIYTATATDPDGDGLTFSLAGGADQAAFRITAAGALSFAAAPDFEAPADADGNNVYLVTLGVSDGTTSDTLGLTVTVTDTGPDEFAVTRVGVGFSQPLFVAPVPDGSGRIFVVQKTGLIRILNPPTGAIAPTPFLNVSGEVSTNSERGLLGLATAPDFATSGVFYVNLTNLAGDTEIRRYRTLAADRNRADPASADLILGFDQPFANHNGGWIDFGPDGFLYIGSGDGGGAGDPQNNGQNSNCSARSCASMSAAIPSPTIPRVTIGSRRTIPSQAAAGEGKCGHWDCAIRSAPVSIP